MTKFERLERLIGRENIETLANASILIIGCGGVGGYAIEALARSNIGNLILVDYDVVSSSNCNRQLIALDSNVGKKKVDCFKKRIQEINANCQVTIYDQKLTSNTIATIMNHKIDFVIDACDDTTAKLELIKYCTIHSIPLISSMGTGNRLNPSQLYITTLDKTQNDPLARVMRQKVKKAKVTQPITVCTSKELPKKQNDTVIASCCFVPGSAGLLIASYVIQTLIKESSN